MWRKIKARIMTTTARGPEIATTPGQHRADRADAIQNSDGHVPSHQVRQNPGDNPAQHAANRGAGYVGTGRFG